MRLHIRQEAVQNSFNSEAVVLIRPSRPTLLHST